MRTTPIAPHPQHRDAIARWLLLCLVLVAVMVALGGVTRLTESGLSIVEWKLFSGTFPPLSVAAWQAEFAAYQHTPQFLQVNSSFTLADFQQIYWLEYLHRLLGRVIGLAVILPLAYYAARRRLPPRLLRRCLLIALLVGAQGAVGWVMVASGLTHEPRVEPIKLAAHLLLALSVFALLLWTYWQLRDQPRTQAATRATRILARFTLALLTLQIAFGALVAGLRAGLSYNTYPLMDGQWVPAGLYSLAPWWRNHLESILMVQFQHRMGAIILLISIVALIVAAYKHPHLRKTLQFLALAVSAQLSLGIATLLSGVNLWLASAHQLVALLLLALVLRIVYLGNPRA